MKSLNTKIRIKGKINRLRKGSIFFADSFKEYNKTYVGKVISEMVKAGRIIRLYNGVFYKPITTQFGILYPDPSFVAKAIANKENTLIMPNGYVALNELGLSTQVPVNYSYLTTGSARTLNIGGICINFKHVSPKNFEFIDPFMATLHQALKCHGMDGFSTEDHQHIAMLVKKYSVKDPRVIEHDIALMPLWIRKMIIETAK